MLEVLTRSCGCSGTASSPPQNCRNIIVNIPPKLSDAAIYSQIEQVSLGIAPDYNSPDITTNNDIPFTLYSEIQVTVRNLSPTVPAINVLVHAYTTAFGIGMPQTYLATQQVNIDKASQVNLSFPLPQSILNNGDPRIGFYIVLEHPYDLKQINNYGSQVISSHDTAGFGRNYQVQVPVCNPSGSSQEIKLSIMPTAIAASITPGTYNFSPYEQIIATLNINVPAAMTGTGINNPQEVTVVGQSIPSNNLIGGITEIIFVNN